MDLVGLLAHVPPLIEACVFDDTPALSRLRLVSKDASRVALLRLRSYTVNLGNVHSLQMRMIRLMQLQALKVSLSLSEATSLQADLTIFVAEAGQVLRGITSLHLEVSGDKRDPTCELLMLVQACTALTSLTTSRSLSPEFFSTLGQLCPHLSSLTIKYGQEDLPQLDQLLLLLPSLVPRLVWSDSGDLRLWDRMADMSKNTGILALDLTSFSFGNSIRQFKYSFMHLWLRKLQHLTCSNIWAGLPAFRDCGHTFEFLHTVELTNYIHISALANLLRAAPVLKVLKQSANTPKRRSDLDPATKINAFAIHIEPPFTLYTVDDFFTVQQRLEAGLIMTAKFRFCFFNQYVREDEKEVLQILLGALPCMSHGKRCVFEQVTTAALRPILHAFPNMTDVKLQNVRRMDDTCLQDLAACTRLKTLLLSGQSKVTPAGIKQLCQQLPELWLVSFCDCPGLTKQSMQECVVQLQAQGKHMTILECDGQQYN